jgi:tetratricopeptide (TPR) repeat protein
MRGHFKDFSGGLKIYFQTFKVIWVFIIAGILFTVSGCAKTFSVPAPMPHKGVPIETGVPGKELEDLSPRAQASLRLTEQGRILLEDGKTNDAISTFEQAINLNPSNGLNYYYLSEAWLSSGKFEQAAEFNRLAEIYLEESSEWTLKVNEQRVRIQRLKR